MTDPLTKAQPISGVQSLRVGSKYAPTKPNAGELVPLKPTQFLLRDASKIPPRQWLYDKRLIAGFLALTVSPGGIGKSSLVLVEAIAMVIRRALLGAMPARPLTVWVWNGEDPDDEIERRITAICMHYGVTADEIGYRLFTDSGRNVPINLAESGREGLVIARPLVEELGRVILENKIDVLIIDPFVTCHTVSENDNGAINAVVSLWREIADRTGCAIELVHHSSKMLGVNSQDVGIAQSRGASALVDGVRSARFITPMTREEADKAGLESPSGYFQVIVGKANLAPKPDDAIWRKMTGVALGNGDGLYPEGDYVGVAEVWQMPDAFDGVTLRDLKKAQDIVEAGEWKCSPVANDWAGFAVAEALDLDAGRGLAKADRTSAQNMARAKCHRVLSTWQSKGAFSKETRPDAQRKQREYVVVGEPVTAEELSSAPVKTPDAKQLEQLTQDDDATGASVSCPYVNRDDWRTGAKPADGPVSQLAQKSPEHADDLNPMDPEAWA